MALWTVHRLAAERGVADTAVDTAPILDVMIATRKVIVT
jgi:hypothetical protein